jgi:phage-related protein
MPPAEKVSNALQSVSRFVSDLADKLTRLLKQAWETTTNSARQTVDFITAIPGRIGALASTMWDAISHSFTAVKNWIGDRVSDIVGFITGIPGRIAGVASSAFDALKDGITGVKNWIGDRVNDIVTTITGIPAKLGDIGNQIGSAITAGIKTAWNFLATTWNSTLGGLGVTIPKEIPIIGGKGISIPNLPVIRRDGGPIPGSLGAPVPLIGHGGEFVLSADVVRAIKSGSATRGLAGSARGGINIEHATFGEVGTIRDLDWWEQTRLAGV